MTRLNNHPFHLLNALILSLYLLINYWRAIMNATFEPQGSISRRFSVSYLTKFWDQFTFSLPYVLEDFSSGKLCTGWGVDLFNECSRWHESICWWVFLIWRFCERLRYRIIALACKPGCLFRIPGTEPEHPQLSTISLIPGIRRAIMTWIFTFF